MRDLFLIDAFKALNAVDTHPTSESPSNDVKKLILSYVKSCRAPAEVRSDLLIYLQDESSTINAKEIAFEALSCSEMITPIVLDVLLKTLRSYNYLEDYGDDEPSTPYIFHRATNALAKIADIPIVTEALLNAIQDKDEQISEAALIVFSKTTLVLPNLVEILLVVPKVHKNERTYDEYGDDNGDKTIEVYNDVVIEILIKACNASPQIFEKVISYFVNPDKSIRLLMLTILAGFTKHNNVSLGALIKSLKDDDDDVRYSAINILGKIPHQAPSVVSALLSIPKQKETVFCDQDDEEGSEVSVTPQGVLTAIEQLADPSDEIVTILIDAYNCNNTDRKLRESILKSLLSKKNYTDPVINLFLKASSEYDVQLRRTVNEALRKIANPTVPVIHALLRSALEERTKQFPYHEYFPDTSYTTYRYTVFSSEAAEYFSKIIQDHPNVLDVIIDAANNDKDPALQEAAVEALCLNHLNPKAIQTLRISLQNKNYIIRQKAASVLIKMTDYYQEVEVQLAEDINSKSWSSAVGALKVFGNLSVLMPSGVPVFIKALANKYAPARDEAIETLAHYRVIPPEMIEKVIELFNKESKSDHVVKLILKTLARIEDPKKNVFDIFEKAIDTKDLCISAINAVGSNGALLNYFQTKLLSLLKQWHRTIVPEVLAVLKNLPTPNIQILDSLVEMYQKYPSHDIRQQIKEILDAVFVGKPLSVETINRLLQLIEKEPQLFSPLVAKLECTAEEAKIFIGAAKSANPNVRYAALRVLGTQKDFSPEILAVFFAALKDKEKSISDLAEEIIKAYMEMIKSDKSANSNNTKISMSWAHKFTIFPRAAELKTENNAIKTASNSESIAADTPFIIAEGEEGERLSPRSTG